MGYYLISSILAVFTCSFIGFFVYFKDRRNPLNIIWLYLSLSGAVWALGYSILISTSNEQMAYFWRRIMDIGAIFGPIFWLTFLYIFLQNYEERKKELILCFSSTLVVLVLNFTPFFIFGLTPKYIFRFYPIPHLGYYLLSIHFAFWISYSFYRLSQAYPHNVGSRRNQLRYIFMGAVLGFGGSGTAFLLTFNIPIPPFGLILFTLYPIIIAYAIIKHRLMDIRIAVTRAGIFLVVYTFILGIPFWVGYWTNSWTISTTIAVILATVGPLVYRALQKKAEALLLAQQRHYQKLLLDAAGGMLREHRLDKILKLIAYVVKRVVKIKFAAVFLIEEESNSYGLKAVRDHDNFPEHLIFPKAHPLISHLRQKREPLVYEEIRPFLKKTSSKEIHLIVPSFVDNNLIGFLALGEKQDHTFYTQDDINVFRILSHQAALAIENAIFYEETGKDLAQQFHEHRLRSIGQMGSKMGHQVNNRFQAILAGMEEAHYLSLNKLQNTDLTNEQKALLDRIEESMVSVEENAKLGGDIAKRLTTFSRKDTKIKPIDLKELISSVLVLLSCKFNPKELNLKLDIEDTTKKIRGDMAQLQDVFFNLFDNTHDAEEKQKSRQKDYIPQTTLRASLKADTWYVELSDNGVGMTEETVDQLFLPFFTTKASSEKGTGIGLSIIKAMVGNLNGTIRVESEYGKETTFYITLPAVEGEEGNA